MVDDLVKVVGCAVVALGVAVAAFFAVTLLLLDDGDQSALTGEVEASVVESTRKDAPRDASREFDYDIVYTYRVGGETFQDEAELSENEWSPGLPLLLCVDPDEPPAHVVKTEEAACGSASVSSEGISTGTPTTAPGD